MKACPHCGGEIQDEAAKCKHCRKMLGSGAGLAQLRGQWNKAQENLKRAASARVRQSPSPPSGQEPPQPPPPPPPPPALQSGDDAVDLVLVEPWKKWNRVQRDLRRITSLKTVELTTRAAKCPSVLLHDVAREYAVEASSWFQAHGAHVEIWPSGKWAAVMNAAITSSLLSGEGGEERIALARAVDRLHPKAREYLQANLGAEEPVRVVIHGASRGQAMIGTSRRVLVFKKGLLAGQVLGENVTSWDYVNVTGVRFEKHLMTGLVVLQAPGVPSLDPSYWTTSSKDADQWRVPNAIPIASVDFTEAKAGVAKLSELVANAHSAMMGVPAASPDDGIPNQIRKLAELRDEGILSPDEFESKKRELLDRL
jgi:hypothetical protein